MSMTSFTQEPSIIMGIDLIVVKRVIVIYEGVFITHHDRYGDHGSRGGVVTFVSEKAGVSNFGSAKRGAM